MASTYDFNITQGEEFSVTFDVKNAGGTPYNLSGDSGYKVSGIAKFRYGDTGALINLDPSGVDGFLDSGRFKVNLSAFQTQQLPICQGMYGLEIYSGSGNATTLVEKVVKGKFSVFPEVVSAGVTSFLVE
tara:strand:- start:175 stop:564 length:390 start_codon:yes stop_codon:yes gene_type:complete